VTFFYGMIAGAYVLGVGTILWACTSEPWPDRAFIAFGWPAALVRNLWRG
jgi:hypothetical protein